MEDKDIQQKIAARKIIRDRSAVGKSGIIYILLAFFVGAIGLHNFYIGAYKRGIAQLLLTLASFLFMFVPLLLVGFWVLIELLFVNHDTKGRSFKESATVLYILRFVLIIVVLLYWHFSGYSEELLDL